MLDLCKPQDLPLPFANAINDVMSGTMPCNHPEIMHNREGFDLVAGNHSLSAVGMGLVDVMSRETVLRQYVDNVQTDYLAAEDMTELMVTVQSIGKHLSIEL